MKLSTFESTTVQIRNRYAVMVRPCHRQTIVPTKYGISLNLKV